MVGFEMLIKFPACGKLLVAVLASELLNALVDILDMLAEMGFLEKGHFALPANKIPPFLVHGSNE